MERSVPGKQSSLWVKESLEYHMRLVVTSFEIRILSVLLALICVNLLKGVVKLNVPPQVSYVLYLWLLTSIAYLVIFQRVPFLKRRRVDNVHFSYYFLGVFYSTLLVHFLGGSEWIASFMYIFDLIYANVLLRRKRGAIVTAFIFLCYFSLIALEYKGIIPHHRIIPLLNASYRNIKYVLGTNVIVMGAMFFLVSYSTGLFSKMKDDRENTLLDSKNRFALKSTQLEKIGRTLKKQVAEKQYLKRATMGYIQKKEFELNAAKKNLEEQIDKQRRTQKSMYFMIADLNQMSTELKQAKDNLEQKVKERTDELLEISQKLHRSERLAFMGKLAGSVTHELRNPLAVLKNAIFYLDNKIDKKKDKKISKYIEIVKKQIGMIDSIIEDIMGFAKTKPPKYEETHLADLVNNVLSAMSFPDLIRIRKNFDDVPPIQIDRNLFTHAFMNIINNAIMAMKGNGILTFRIREEDTFIVLEVEDTGGGIPVEEMDLIFEPLYSSKPKGTGLGLPIAKMMIENQEGRIDFTTDPGRGTTFSIYLLKREEDEGED